MTPPLADAQLAALVPHKGLRAIIIAKSDITDAGLLCLVEMKKLESIQIKASPQVTDVGIAALKNLRPDLKVTR